MSTNHHVFFRHLNVGNLRIGEVQAEGFPVFAIGKRDPNTVFGTRVEQAGAGGILPNGVDVGIGPKPVDDFFPGLTVVVSFPDIRSAVVHLIPFGGYVGRAGFVARCIDQADSGVFWHIGRGDFLPVFAVVAGDVQQAIVGTGPNRVDIVE